MGIVVEFDKRKRRSKKSSAGGNDAWAFDTTPWVTRVIALGLMASAVCILVQQHRQKTNQE